MLFQVTPLSQNTTEKVSKLWWWRSWGERGAGGGVKSVVLYS